MSDRLTADDLWHDRTERGLDWLVRELRTNSSLQGDQELLNELLDLAIEERDLEAIHALHQSGADVVHVTSWNLIDAVARGNLSRAKEMLNLGADVNFRRKDGFTAFDFAIGELDDQKALDVVTFLVGQGADIELRGTSNGTPLNSAAAWGKLRVAAFLVQRGARTTIRNVDGYTPRDVAVLQGYDEVAALLLKPEMAERRGAGHAVDLELVAEAIRLAEELEQRFAKGEDCGKAHPRFVDELRLQSEAHLRGDVSRSRLKSWCSLVRARLAVPRGAP